MRSISTLTTKQTKKKHLKEWSTKNTKKKIQVNSHQITKCYSLRFVMLSVRPLAERSMSQYMRVIAITMTTQITDTAEMNVLCSTQQPKGINQVISSKLGVCTNKKAQKHDDLRTDTAKCFSSIFVLSVRICSKNSKRNSTNFCRKQCKQNISKHKTYNRNVCLTSG